MQDMKGPESLKATRASALSVACLLLTVFSGGCSRNQTTEAPALSVKVESMPDPSVVEVPNPGQFALASVEQRPSFSELKVNGVVAPDVSRTASVVSLSGGRVIEIRARLGDEVKKGQVLLRINSQDVSQAFSDYQKAKTSEELNRLQLERAQSLYAKGAIAKKDLEAAEQTEDSSKIDVATSLDHLRLLGADPDHPSPIVDLRAPASGTIVAQNVAGGNGVRSLDASPDLFDIADLSRVWVLCDVYENNLSQVRLGDFADLRLNSFPDRRLRGRIGNISRMLDPATHTAKVRLELDNPGGLMRAGMFGIVTFRSQSEQLRLVVPAKAVLRLHDKDWVFRAEGGRRFRRIEIQAGRVSDDGFEEVLTGLAPGDKIVANALQFSSAADTE